MKNYIIYNDMGTILRTGACSENMLSLQAKDNEFLLLGIANDADHVVNISSELIEDRQIDTEHLQEDFMEEFRILRDRLLTASDWTQMPDTMLTNLKRIEWQTYRKELRDLPESYLTETNLDNIILPVKPSK